MDDLPRIIALLAASGLPTDDVHACLPTMRVVQDSGRLIGVVGLEPYGRIGLLRSLVVSLEYRNRGVAQKLWGQIKTLALELEIADIYLLTETAESFFGTLGFVTIARDAAPQPIRESRQFTELCPASAVLMRQSLAGSMEP
ncbi:MAG: arsenic resistance N-acetyltransferase ArsN2 [Gammaproteobacteria bacterium]|nr:arsenic resistance N-acetyltransferase ArsN2 [Gammaproteobacteria bacterium]